MNKPPKLLVVIAILFCKLAFAQPANDNCANATSLSTGLTCVAGVNSLSNQTLSGATVEGAGFATSCGGATASPDVWYKFVAQCPKPTITISNKGTSWSTFMRVQLLSGTCGSWGELDCKNNPTSFSPTSNLTIGTTYYIRILKTTTTAPTGSTWGFDICITGGQQSRLAEVFKQTIIVPSSTITTPWEVTYGPDGYLWVTGSQDYKAYRIDPNTSPYTPVTILDIHKGSATSELTAGEHTAYNVQFTAAELSAMSAWGPSNTTTVPWPQGGFAGLALHPQFLSGKPYVYISYVHRYDSASATIKGGFYYTNSLVRFTYNSGTNKLETPVTVCDTLPGSNDHNSQRIIIALVGGTNYLFYGQGDMGAGQLNTQWRPNHAQDSGSYQGKILRFNLEPDADGVASDQWIPNDNPYNHSGTQSAIWAIGIRNNQGFAYNSTTDVLYGSSHGPYSDDEINIIQRYKNYGHPLIEGYSSDGNYNGSSAGETFATNGGVNSLAVIGNEVTNAATINSSGFALYKDPLFSGYPGPTTGSTSVASIWSTIPKPNNKAWPSEAWSGLDVYTSSYIPGWRNSLIACGMKWGRVLRIKLDPTGTSIVQTNGADTVAYWQGPSRYRDVAFSPDGKDIYVSIDGTGTATGPGGNAPYPSVAKCDNCIIKYSFLGYADIGGKSSIPDAVAITDTSTNALTGGATLNTLTSASSVTIDVTNNNLWVPITGPDGNILAEINANGNNLGAVTSTFYIKGGTNRQDGTGLRYLNRSMTITPTTQPSSAVKIRLYITNAEYTALDNDAFSGVSALTDLKIRKNNDLNSIALTNTTTNVPLTFSGARSGTNNGYYLQADITSFSSFYIGSTNLILPVTLIDFKGHLQDNATLLEWKTTSETNTASFIVERSVDAHNFQPIGSVAAKGNSTSTVDYNYTDNDVTKQSSSVIYYRLKIMDKDGAFKYSSVISITLPFITPQLSVYPNPVVEEANVSVVVPEDGKLDWKLTDNAGRTILKSNKQMQKGNNNFTINVTKLPAGIYYLSVSGAGIDKQIKIQKQ